jgi:uncharacterized protein YoaH (UPF0181 family)
VSLIHAIKAAIESYNPDNLEKFELYQHIAHELYAAGHSQSTAIEIVARTVDRTKIIANDSETLEDFKEKLEDRFAHLRKDFKV